MKKTFKKIDGDTIEIKNISIQIVKREDLEQEKQMFEQEKKEIEKRMKEIDDKLTFLKG